MLQEWVQVYVSGTGKEGDELPEKLLLEKIISMSP